MNRATDLSTPAVPPEEVERRIAEYRRLGMEYQGPPQVVYHPAQQRCPWPDCSYRIAGISFQLDNMGAASAQARWLTAWWQGPGLAGRCPGCRRYVLFALREKRALPDLSAVADAVLPDDWPQRAHVVLSKTGGE